MTVILAKVGDLGIILNNLKMIALPTEAVESAEG